MNSELLDALIKGGPVVVVVGAFLWWDYRKGVTAAKERTQERTEAAKERAERDGQLISALDRNSDTLDRLDRSLSSRPCLWENGIRQIAKDFREAADRVVRKQGETSGG